MTRAQMEMWQQMLARSFNPAQWFDQEARPDPEDEGKTMWVYKQDKSGLFLVGYWTPNKRWVLDSKWEDKDNAAARVHYLNGGN